MRKTTVLLAVLTFFAFTFKANAQLKLGLGLGANVSNLKYNYEDSDTEPTTTSIIAPRIGLALDVKVPAAPIGIGTGLYYSGKGAATDLEETYDGADNVDGTQKTNIGYLELPVHVKFSMLKVLRLYVGPYAAMGIMGKQKNDYTVEANTIIEEYKDDFDAEFTDLADTDFDYTKNFPVKAMDMGIDFGIGVKIPKFGVHAGYSMGLTNISPDIRKEENINGQNVIVETSADDKKTKTSAFQFGVTYYF